MYNLGYTVKYSLSPWEHPLGSALRLRLYCTVYPSSRHNTNTITPEDLTKLGGLGRWTPWQGDSYKINFTSMPSMLHESSQPGCLFVANTWPDYFKCGKQLTIT